MRFLLVLVLLFLPSSVLAQEMTSPSYTLELEQIESTGDAQLQTLSAKQMKQFDEDGYLINTPKKGTLLFTITDTILALKENQNTQETSALTSVSSIKEATEYDDEFGYQIIGRLMGPYHVSGPDSPIEFIDETYYRPVKNTEYEGIARNDWTTFQRSSKIIMKFNKSESQAEENFDTTITLIALPSL